VGHVGTHVGMRNEFSRKIDAGRPLGDIRVERKLILKMHLMYRM